jgi:Domain of unknown function (DUF4168)
MEIIRTVAATAAIVFLLPFVSLAQQTPPQQPGAQQSPAQQTDLNDTQLRSFARAYVQIEKIHKTYDPQLNDAKNPEEGLQVQREEMSKIQQALTQEVLDAQSYHHIVQIANADEGLRKKIIGFINEERQKS